MPTFPAGLPKLEQSSYTETPRDTNVRTSMDAGPTFSRRRFTKKTSDVSGDLILTAAQLVTLETFYDTTLRGGSLSFDWVNQRTDVAAVFRFNGPLQIRAISGNDYAVGCTLVMSP
jgi:hypothetical protein